MPADIFMKLGLISEKGTDTQSYIIRDENGGFAWFVKYITVERVLGGLRKALISTKKHKIEETIFSPQ